jgi:hypothetical protein
MEWKSLQWGSPEEGSEEKESGHDGGGKRKTNIG